MPRHGPRYTREEARAAIAASVSFTEALRRLGMRPAGGNHRTLKRYAQEWEISTEHFDPYAASRGPRATATPIEDVLVENSTYSRGLLKRRLYALGLKLRRCELCGQSEEWRGRHMSLILDHINGNATDNRLENLRIVCPNCAATLDTHCGRNLVRTRSCGTCGRSFKPRTRNHRFCSRRCGYPAQGPRGPQPERRRVERPPYEQLLAEIEATSYCAVGRKYGVSDNAIRKWVRQYRRERVRLMVHAGRMRGPVTIVLRRAPRPCRGTPTARATATA